VQQIVVEHLDAQVSLIVGQLDALYAVRLPAGVRRPGEQRDTGEPW
jgi:hypothetical protein